MTTLIQLIFAHFDAAVERLDDATVAKSGRYDDPVKMLSTLYNIIAINSHVSVFADRVKQHQCSKTETLVVLLQVFAKDDAYMRMEFLYKFVFMMQSIRKNKSFDAEEKSLIQKIYATVKKQYISDHLGAGTAGGAAAASIPQNDARF